MEVMMNRWMKLSIVALVMVMVMSLIGDAGVANAQGNDTPRLGRVIRVLADTVLDATQKATGMSRVDIIAAARDGKSLSAVITEHGGSVDAVKAEAKAAALVKIDQAVTDGILTNGQATLLKGKLDQALDKILNRTAQDRKTGVERLLKTQGLHLLVKETAAQTNLKPSDIGKGLNDGKTLAQIATANNADPAKIVTATLKTATDRINTAVKNGKITQDQANTLLSTLQEGLTKAMNTEHPFKAIRTQSSTATK
jgi:ribosomal protein S20